jgi:hypothetical protein
MARSARPEIEDAGPSAGDVVDGAIPASVQDSSRLMLEVWRLCAQWSRQAEVGHARTLEGLDAPLAAAVSRVGSLQSWQELGEVVAALWRASFDEFRKHQGDLPYSWATVQFDIAKHLIACVSDAMALQEGAGPARVDAGSTPAPADLNQEMFEQWLRHWAALLPPGSTPPK